MSYAFSDSAIKGLERYILANVRAACSMLSTGENRNRAEVEKGKAGEKGETGEASWTDGSGFGGSWNVAHWCNWLVFDIMGDLVFGKAFGMLEGDANRFAIEMVGNAAHRHLIVSLPLLLPSCDSSIRPSGCTPWTIFRSASETVARRAIGLDIEAIAKK